MIVHQEDSGPGVFLDPLRACGAELVSWWPVADREPPGAPGEFDAILTFGGSANPDAESKHPWLVTEKAYLAEALAQRVPMFGVCLGAELLSEAAGTPSIRSPAGPEIGWYRVTLTPAAEKDPVFAGLERSFTALGWHSFEVPLPAGAVELAHSAKCLQAFRIGETVWGIQFHAEVTAQDFQVWLDTAHSDEDAVRIELDVDVLGAESEDRLAEWHELGRRLCERFLRVAVASAE